MLKMLAPLDGDDDAVDVARTIGRLRERLDAAELQIETHLDRDRIGGLADRGRLLWEASDGLSGRTAELEEDARSETLVEIEERTGRLRDASDGLRRVRGALAVLERLSALDGRLRECRRIERGGDLAATAAALAAVADALDDPDDPHRDALRLVDLHQKMRAEHAAIRERAAEDLSERWGRVLSWSEGDDDSVEIEIDGARAEDGLLEALVSSGRMTAEMKKFSSFLMGRVLGRLIRERASVVAAGSTLTVKFLPAERTNLNYEDVLLNLKSAFGFLDATLPRGAADPVETIGELVRTEFSETLIRDCLVHTIPNRVGELQNYGEVTSRVEAFQRYLSGIRFFGDDVSILRYASNIDALFADKTGQYFLENARFILKKDLGNTMSVGSETTTPENEPAGPTELDADDRELVDYFFSSFRVSPFRFPRCAISRSVHELLDLVAVMMEQATEASDLCARRLYYTVRNVFELYMAIVPLHHKQLLETMPQQIALFHNNCIYLAHHLLILGPKWQKNFAGRDMDYNIVFYDQVKELRDLATHTLLTHMRAQRKQILDTLRSSDIYYIAIKDVLSDNAEQAVRQCIRQLQVLKTVWSGIFPSDVYRRLITCLAHVFVEELICKVINQEDITAEVASQLTDIYKIVLNRLPQIYNDESIIHNNVSCWMKFNELVLVLGGNLATIEERWFNGSGPLAVQFKPDEIKRLIRALFQNTTFRANLIAKIK